MVVSPLFESLILLDSHTVWFFTQVKTALADFGCVADGSFDSDCEFVS